jgi:hypothetical protein
MAEIEKTRDAVEQESGSGALTAARIILILLVVAALTILVLTLIGPSVSSGVYSNIMLDI